MRVCVVTEEGVRIPMEVVPTAPLLSQLKTAPGCRDCAFFSFPTDFLNEEASAAGLGVTEDDLFDAFTPCDPEDGMREAIARVGLGHVGFRFAGRGRIAISVPISRT